MDTLSRAPKGTQRATGAIHGLGEIFCPGAEGLRAGGQLRKPSLTINKHSHCGKQPGHIQQRLLLVVQRVECGAYEGIVVVLDRPGSVHRIA